MRVPYFSQVLSVPNGTIFGGTNNEMKNTQISHMPLYKEEEEEGGGEFTEEKNFING